MYAHAQRHPTPLHRHSVLRADQIAEPSRGGEELPVAIQVAVDDREGDLRLVLQNVLVVSSLVASVRKLYHSDKSPLSEQYVICIAVNKDSIIAS